MNNFFFIIDVVLKIIISYTIYKATVNQYYIMMLMILGLISILLELFMIKKCKLEYDNKGIIIGIIAKIISLVLMIVTHFIKFNIGLVLIGIAVVLFFFPMTIFCYKEDYKLRYLASFGASIISICFYIYLGTIFDMKIILYIIVIVFLLLYELIIFKMFSKISKNKVLFCEGIHFLVCIVAFFIAIFMPISEYLLSTTIGFLSMMIILSDYIILKYLKDKL